VAILVLAGCGQGQDSAGDEVGLGNDEDFGVISSELSTVNTKITLKPPLVSNSTTAKFKFKCTSAPCSFKCNFDGAGWKKCKSPKTYTGLSEGAHNFQVKAGKNGVWDKSPARYSWSIYLVPSIDGGGVHTCALASNGGVKCWGRNNYGQLGNGNTADSNVPVDVSGLSSGISAISAGNYHTCAVLTSGGVKCWGWNGYGELGNGNTADSNVPVNVSGLSFGIASIFAGGYHTCALTSSGGIKCWGRNNCGQFGNGNKTDSNVPVDVSGLSSGISAISAGRYHTCALTSDGGVKCWGDNYSGQLGNGNNTDSNVPVDVSGLSSGVSAISAGGYGHTCGLLTSGGVKCWGRNNYGQLGNGNNTDSNVPVDVSGLSSGVSAISAGLYHTCGLLTSGGVKCWGDNYSGQLGNGNNTDSNVPVDVLGFGP